MKIEMLMGCLLLAALVTTLLAAAPGLPSMRKLHRMFGYPPSRLAINALGDGMHLDGKITKLADVTFATRHLLLAEGSDAAHVALCTASDVPLGVCYDEADAVEDAVGLRLLGNTGGSVLMVASEAMATTRVPVYAAAGGKIALTGVVRVGRLLSTASADGEEVEVEPCQPMVDPGGKTVKAGGTLAVPITHRSVLMTTGGAEALTLADGLPGQELHLVLGTDGGDGTLTPATCTGFATLVFADAKDAANLKYIDDTVGWIVTGTAGVAAPPALT